MTTGEDGEVLREQIARAIDPSVWEHRDECLTRREAWDSEIKVGWPDFTFEQWANRGTRKSLKTADAILALIAPVMEENERLREATQTLVDRIDRLSEGQCGPFAIKNSIANSAEMDAVRAALSPKSEGGK
jgi:hypothetical protein